MKNFSRRTARSAPITRSSVMPRSITCWRIICSRRVVDSTTSFMSLHCTRSGGRTTSLTAAPARDYFQGLHMRERRQQQHQQRSTTIDYAAAPVSPRVADRPIVTLTTDFGLRDHYVAAMKAVLIRECPAARLIDVTHSVPRHDILCASITLERAIDGFPKNTVHL